MESEEEEEDVRLVWTRCVDKVMKKKQDMKESRVVKRAVKALLKTYGHASIGRGMDGPLRRDVKELLVNRRWVVVVFFWCVCVCVWRCVKRCEKVGMHIGHISI